MQQHTDGGAMAQRGRFWPEELEEDSEETQEVGKSPVRGLQALGRKSRGGEGWGGVGSTGWTAVKAWVLAGGTRGALSSA